MFMPGTDMFIPRIQELKEIGSPSKSIYTFHNVI